MKKTLLIIYFGWLFGLSLASCNPWKQMNRVVREIAAPTFPDRIVEVADFLLANDTLYTHAINAAIKHCSEQGGGTVLLPTGNIYTGPIVMRSNVNLHLDTRTHLLFITNRSQFATVLTRIEGIDCLNLSPLVYAYEAENIAITGGGILDGQASDCNWFDLGRLQNVRLRDGRIGHEKTLLNEALAKDLPIEERVFSGEEGMRPQFIHFYKCRNILIEDVLIVNSPFWLIHPLLSENITIRRVTMNSHGRNNDGCNPESCRNVLIEDCYFDTGDDCIAIKSGKEGDGRKWNTPSENIVIRRCLMKDGHAAVAFGSEITGGCRNVWVENCQMDSPNMNRIIRLKSNPQRGGNVNNIFVRNITIGECSLAILGIELKYWGVKDGPYPPSFHNICMEDIKCHKCRYMLHIDALDSILAAYDISIKNCHFDSISETDINHISGEADIKIKKTYVNSKKLKLTTIINH